MINQWLFITLHLHYYLDNIKTKKNCVIEISLLVVRWSCGEHRRVVVDFNSPPPIMDVKVKDLLNDAGEDETCMHGWVSNFSTFEENVKILTGVSFVIRNSRNSV